MKTYYFLTVDKVLGTEYPSKDEYFSVLDELCQKYSLRHDNKNHVECFEYKKKGNKRKGTQVFDWVHYHGIYVTDKEHKRDLKLFKLGYSIKAIKIKDISDMLRISGYIQKSMIDQVGYSRPLSSESLAVSKKMNNIFDEYAFED